MPQITVGGCFNGEKRRHRFAFWLFFNGSFYYHMFRYKTSDIWLCWICFRNYCCCITVSFCALPWVWSPFRNSRGKILPILWQKNKIMVACHYLCRKTRKWKTIIWRRKATLVAFDHIISMSFKIHSRFSFVKIESHRTRHTVIDILPLRERASLVWLFYSKE